MKTNKISLAGYVLGFIIIGIAIYKYAIFVEDMGRLFQWLLLGILTIGVFFNYSRRRTHEKRFDYNDTLMEEYVEGNK